MTLLDQSPPVDVVIELVIVLAAKLGTGHQVSDYIQMFLLAVLTHLGIQLFFGHNLGHVRVESNLHRASSAVILLVWYVRCSLPSPW